MPLSPRVSHTAQATRHRERHRQRALRAQRRARRAVRQCRRPSTVPPVPPVPPPPPLAGPAAGAPPAEGQPAFASLRAWLSASLGSRHVSAWLLTRLALLLLGLLAGQDGSVNGIARTAKAQGVSGAKRASVSRRVKRLLDDTRLDPDTLLRDVLRPLVPVLLAEVLTTHVARAAREPTRHRRAPLLRLVLDESNHLVWGHILVVGLAYRGIVLPLALRVWAQNVPLPEGAYWGSVHSALQEVYDLLPGELRDHVLVLADRAYGVPRMLDLLRALGWDWALRIQGQVRVRLRDGRVLPVRDLAPRPGTAWLGGFDPRAAPHEEADRAAPPDAADAPTTPPLDVFKTAGWRQSQVVAVWATGQDEPWLLLTSLAPTADRLVDYATRWAIERLFLSWKSAGWNLEATGVTDPARLGRLLSGYVLATHWRLAAGVLEATIALADLERHQRRRASRPRTAPPSRQLALPLWPGPGPRQGDPRPDAAKHSLFSLGTYACLETPCRFYTPAVCWTFPDWEAPTWSRQAQFAYDGLAP